MPAERAWPRAGGAPIDAPSRAGAAVADSRSGWPPRRLNTCTRDAPSPDIPLPFPSKDGFPRMFPFPSPSRRAHGTRSGVGASGRAWKKAAGGLGSAPSGGCASGSRVEARGPSSSSGRGAAGRHRAPDRAGDPAQGSGLSECGRSCGCARRPRSGAGALEAHAGEVVEPRIADGKRGHLRRAQAAGKHSEDRDESVPIICHTTGRKRRSTPGRTPLVAWWHATPPTTGVVRLLSHATTGCLRISGRPMTCSRARFHVVKSRGRPRRLQAERAVAGLYRAPDGGDLRDNVM